MSYFLFCNRPTDGGRALIQALGGKRIRTSRSKFIWRKRKAVINWGCTDAGGRNHPMLNTPAAISVATNKLRFFQAMAREGVADKCVPFTAYRKLAEGWVAEGAMVVARKVLNGHSGAGIEIVGGKNPMVNAPLYTKYVPKDEEWRIHYMKDRQGVVHPIYIQKKVKRADFEGKPNRYVRNHDNGYTYQYNGVSPSHSILQTGASVFAATGLDFGAVDIIYVRASDKALVLEINTAPGLEGHSVEVYSAAFRRHHP